jgi:hypothetical protein
MPTSRSCGLHPDSRPASQKQQLETFQGIRGDMEPGRDVPISGSQFLFSESTFPLSSVFIHYALLLDSAFKQLAQKLVFSVLAPCLRTVSGSRIQGNVS